MLKRLFVTILQISPLCGYLIKNSIMSRDRQFIIANDTLNRYKIDFVIKGKYKDAC